MNIIEFTPFSCACTY